MSGNRFGTLFQYQTFGESHGPAIGCIVDGVPPRLPLSEADIQGDLDRRKPGQSRFTTQRREGDVVEILSGVFEGRTTGAPIGLLIRNEDTKSKDYADIKDKFRPGHADFTYQAKIRHPRLSRRRPLQRTRNRLPRRGGGRLRSWSSNTTFRLFFPRHPGEGRDPRSGRDVSGTVNPGLRRDDGTGTTIRAAVIQIGPHAIDRANWDWAQVAENPFFAPDAAIVGKWADFIDAKRKSGSSAGAIVEVVADGVPAGLGAPVYDKLDSDLAKALMSINAVKGVEIGDGFAAALLGGEENADEIRRGPDGQPHFLSNHAGGILGGISTGQPVVARIAIKPTSSILTPVRTVDVGGNDTDIVTKGRHDPCVGIRAVPVAEAMMACVLADHWLRHKAQCN